MVRCILYTCRGLQEQGGRCRTIAVESTLGCICHAGWRLLKSFPRLHIDIDFYSTS